MKNRKKSTRIKIEERNANYRKTIIRNRELANKNTLLSHRINNLQNEVAILEESYFHRLFRSFWNLLKKLNYKFKNW